MTEEQIKTIEKAMHVAESLGSGEYLDQEQRAIVKEIRAKLAEGLRKSVRREAMNEQ